MIGLFHRKMIHVFRCEGMTRKIMRLILIHDPQLEMIYHQTAREISQYYGISYERSVRIFEDLHSIILKEQLEIELKRYHIITIHDVGYPELLKNIKDPPLVLYALGDLSLLQQQPAISVIGTRKPSSEAGSKTAHIITPLIKRNWIIVSGLARGIDSYAHRIALFNQGKTIAVIGCGLEHIYPAENDSLYKQIEQNGLILSEYPPYVRPKPYHFPERNRIISGLSFATLVIEATSKSGTLITVDQALDQGREVYAVPGSILNQQSIGCHKMIQDGAKLVTNEAEIIEDWDHLKTHVYR